MQAVSMLPGVPALSLGGDSIQIRLSGGAQSQQQVRCTRGAPECILLVCSLSSAYVCHWEGAESGQGCWGTHSVHRSVRQLR